MVSRATLGNSLKEHPTVIELLERSVLPEPGQLINVAASGGPDSTALALLAAARGCIVSLHHVNHHLRPDSHHDADLVVALAERLEAECFVHDVEVEPGPNLEERARQARQAALPNNHATGHTLDDRAETMLINLMRGAGLDGVAALAGSLRHPIVGLRRHETHWLVGHFDVPVAIDSSNADPRFVRNRVRSELLPLMNEIAQRDVTPLLGRFSQAAADDMSELNLLSDSIDSTDAAALRNVSPVLARRALRRWLRSDLGHSPDGAALERVMAVVRGEVLACEIAGIGRVRRSQGQLILEPLHP
jgi:tRNA(Ile)-lysidine synthase